LSLASLATSWPIFALFALALDLILKDPPGWPHPVRLFGLALQRLEPAARSSRVPLRMVGGISVVLMMALAWLAVAVLTSLPAIGWLLALYFSYAGLALGGLLQEGRQVARLLRRGEIDQARKALAGLVSRDVTHLDEAALRRALAETISENLNDAFIAPFFYLLLLGPAGLWAYKAVSTMDSMWGYTTARYRELGWAAARMDDLLAFVPARLSALCMVFCARAMSLTYIPTWKELAGHAARTTSPNAGWPMAAAALILQAGMGGPTPYFGEIKSKPWLGPRERLWKDDTIDRLLRLARNAGLCFALLGSALYFALNAVFA
jgi:adenosylcobinamide-phosphate synthase